MEMPLARMPLRGAAVRRGGWRRRAGGARDVSHVTLPPEFPLKPSNTDMRVLPSIARGMNHNLHKSEVTVSESINLHLICRV